MSPVPSFLPVARFRKTAAPGWQARLAAFLLLTALPAHAEKEGDFEYSIKDNAVTITSHTGSDGAVSFPDKIAGHPVRKISLPVDQSGVRAKLTSVTIPASVTDIYIDIFRRGSLVAFNVAPDNSMYRSMDGALFDKKGTTLIHYPGGKEGDYAIPAGVTSIGNRAFAYCGSLTGVTIPASVTTIGGEAFLDCKSLTRVTVPAGVTSIGIYAFSGCAKLASIAIPASVTALEDSVFPGCTSLSAIAVDAANPSYRSADGVLFDKKETKLIQYPAGRKGNYVIPPTVTEIGESAFSECSGLTSITLPASVSGIAPSAFSRCTSLTSVTIPVGVSTLGDGAFFGCTALTSTTFEGDAPSTNSERGRSHFGGTAPDFTIRHYKGSTGFDAPEWNKYTKVEIDPATEVFSWISTDGKELKAKFIKLDGQSVVIEKEDGKQFTLPLAKLAPASAAWAKRLGELSSPAPATR